MSGYFKNLKVVELAGVLAGPAVGTFFAELGADVLKVENKRVGGDVTRGWRVNGESKSGPSAYYSSVNYRKKVFSCDLTTKADLKELKNHIQNADMVVSNYLPRVAKKFQLDYDSIKTLNPQIIFLEVKGYEKEGRPAFDVVLQAETGWISMTGTNKDHPAKLPVALIDVLAGHQLKEAALLALLHRERTGEGSYSVCTLEKASLSALANQASNYLMAGKVAEPIGTAHPNIAPYGDWFESKDGFRFVLAIGSDAHFQKITEIIEETALSDDERFRTNSSRVMNRTALIEQLQAAFAMQNFGSLSAKMKDLGVPFGEIKSLDRVLEGQVARECVLSQMIEEKETYRMASVAFKSSFLDSI